MVTRFFFFFNLTFMSEVNWKRSEIACLLGENKWILSKTPSWLHWLLFCYLGLPVLQIQSVLCKSSSSGKVLNLKPFLSTAENHEISQFLKPAQLYTCRSAKGRDVQLSKIKTWEVWAIYLIFLLLVWVEWQYLLVNLLLWLRQK